MKRKPLLLIVLIIFVTLAVLLPTISTLVTDWYWFSAEGYPALFLKVLLTKLILGVVVALVSFGFIYLNISIAIRLTKKQTPIFESVQMQIQGVDLSKLIRKILKPLAIVIGLFTGISATAYWEVVLKFMNTVSFNAVDPVFNRDLSFYFFTLPFIKMILGFLFWIVIVSLIALVIFYITRGLMQIKKGRAQIERKARTHLSILGAFIFLLIAAHTYFISMTNLLYSSTGPFTGASYSDIYASMPLLWAVLMLAVLTAGAFIVNIFVRKRRLVTVFVGLYVLVGVAGVSIYPAIIQRLVVLPNELIKETPYIERNIYATRKAFKLDSVVKRDLTNEDAQLTMEDIQNNEITIKNIRLWDRKPLLDTFGQIQEIRTYYDFVSIDNDRYMIDGEYRQTMLSPRELNSKSLPSTTFINETLVFTHGFGLALGPVNEVTKEGLPLLFIQDLPPRSSTESLSVSRPEIYFGELSSDYVFVNTDAQEFNYPAGEENVYSDYDSDGGVLIDSFLKKALFAARFSSLKILLSNDITNKSRVLYYRTIRERVQKALPFLTFDGDPYMVIADNGSLQWIYDAYTMSGAYPYSELVGGDQYGNRGTNYIRNSVKITIDAYDGSMNFYIADTDDPIIKVYEKIFPDTFRDLDEMPADIRLHVRYPEDIFKYQTALYETYHMEQPQIFYNKEDEWQVPQIGEERSDPMMRHMIMKLPEEESEEFILMLPYTPRNKDNLAAWMVARSDGDHYGELVVYRFPKQRLVFGPKQIVNRINQDPDISQQISLWDQRGSEVNQGNLLVIPIEESLLYVRPLYIRAEGGKIPELKRVIVAYENQIAMAETLDGALQEIFSGTAAVVTDDIAEVIADEVPVSQTSDELITQANTHYQNALSAQKAGDWTKYGKEIEALGDVLNQLNP